MRKSTKDRQHNGQKKKDKRTNNDLQNTTQKIKDWITRTSLKTQVLRKGKQFISDLRYSEDVDIGYDRHF